MLALPSRKKNSAGNDAMAPILVPTANHNGTMLVGRVRRNERMTSSDWSQDVRHVVLEILSLPAGKSASTVAASKHAGGYIAGDIAAIFPTNVFDIEGFAVMMGYALDEIVTVAGVPGQPAASQGSLRGWHALWSNFKAHQSGCAGTLAVCTAVEVDLNP